MTISDPYETLRWSAIDVGDELPPMVLDVTATRIVAGAIATRDFMPVHHDRDYANTQGAPDIFMNILSDTGYCSRFLTELAIRLGVPQFPGGTLTYTGSVIAKAEAGGLGTVEVALTAVNDLGDHVSGTAVLTFER
jgi:acyl dehydratase